MSEKQAQSDDIKQAMFNASLIKALQSVMIVVTLVGGVLGPLYAFFIQPQFDQLNKRQEKVELQVNDIQKQQNGLDKNMAIMVEQIKGIGDNVKDIKDSLKK
jgi:predicted PurR-regulated permease PerM